MKTAGIIGGMGPGTTADFYKDINGLAETQGAMNRPELLIWNIPLDYAVEQELLVHETGLEKYLPLLKEGAIKLEKAGSDFLVVPCNTVHELFDEFSSEVDIPFLHIVDETVKTLQRRDVGEIGLLATGQTIGSNLYQGFLDEAGIGYSVPNDDDQDHLNDIVARLVTGEGAAAAKNGEQSEDAKWLNGLVDGYVSKAGAVVLGCTDFHIMLEARDPGTVIDSMHELAVATVDKIYEN